MKIGIPSALLYPWYGEIWKNFWEECGLEVVVSPSTDRSLMLAGSKVSLDEICLPIKIFLGHFQWLAPKADWVMVPHLVKIQPKSYLCPKFLGLPDLVEHTLPGYRSKICQVTVDVGKVDHLTALRQAALKLGVPNKKIPKKLSQSFLKPVLETLPKHRTPGQTRGGLRLGVLGHPYCIYDGCFNMNILSKLAGYEVDFYTPEMLPYDFQGLGAGKLSKELFWSMGRLQVDALDWMLSPQGPQVEGFIHLTTFACGPEAIIGDLLERQIKQAGLPLLKIYFEEHTGEAGMVTRLEAFVDLIKYRSRVC